MATTVSRRRICPNLVKRRIFALRRGKVARMVVRAELRMDTPMNEIAERTRFTLRLALWVNWKGRGGGGGGREREREGEREREREYEYRQGTVRVM